MISTASMVACAFTLAISLLGPVLILILYAGKNRKQGIVSAWFLGAAGFFIPQILIRVPILNALSVQSGFVSFAMSHPMAYTLSLAFTAGLSELAGRFAVAKILEKKLTYRRGLAAGLGHGGIEAIVIVGMAYINNLVMMVMIQSGSFDELLAQTAAMGVDVSQLQAAQTALISTAPAMFLLAGLERVLTMALHAAMSLMVCWGVHTKKPGRAVLACLLFHTLVDTTAGISLLATEAGGSVLSQNAAYGIIYAVLIAMTVLSLIIIRKIRRAWMQEQDPADKELPDCPTV